MVAKLYVCLDADVPEEWRHATQHYLNCHLPREQYRRTFVLLPQQDEYDAADWRQGAAIGGARHLLTMGHSADDAGIGPDVRNVIAVNERENYAPRALPSFLDTFYPGAEYERITAKSPADLGIQLLDVLEDELALGQSWEEWKDMRFGEDAATKIGQYGCLLTGLSIVLRFVYERDVTPPILDRLLVAARTAYWNDNLLDWHAACGLFSRLGETVKANYQLDADELTSMLNAGWQVILYRASPSSHFVYLVDVTLGGDLVIIDTWDGQYKQKSPSIYAGIRAVKVVW